MNYLIRQENTGSILEMILEIIALDKEWKQKESFLISWKINVCAFNSSEMLDKLDVYNVIIKPLSLGWGCGLVVEHLPRMLVALHLIPNSGIGKMGYPYLLVMLVPSFIQSFVENYQKERLTLLGTSSSCL
jgi:hypothetical protein